MREGIIISRTTAGVRLLQGPGALGEVAEAFRKIDPVTVQDAHCIELHAISRNSLRKRRKVSAPAPVIEPKNIPAKESTKTTKSK